MVAVYASLLGLTTVIASLRYELAIPLPESDTEAANVTALSLILVGCMTVLSAVLISILREPISTALNLPELKEYLWLLPVGTLTVGMYNIFNYWAVRTKQFRSIAVTRVVQSTTTLLVNLAAFKWGGFGLLLGQVIGQSAGSLKLGKIALLSSSLRDVTWEGVQQAAMRYKNFPKYSTGEGFANTAGLQLPPILYAFLFGTTAAGLYTLANRVLSMPLTLVGNAIGQVFFSRAAEAHRKNQLGTMVENLSGALLYVGLPPTVLIATVGDISFSMVFGDEWKMAGQMAQLMSPWLLMVFVTSPMSTLFGIVEKQGQGLVFQLTLMISRIIALSIGFLNRDIFMAVAGFSVASFVCYMALLIWYARLVNVNARRLLLTGAKLATLAIACISPICLVRYVSVETSLLVVGLLASFVFVLAYYWKLRSYLDEYEHS